MAASDGVLRTAEGRENAGWTDSQEHRRARKASERKELNRPTREVGRRSKRVKITARLGPVKIKNMGRTI